VLNAVVSGWPVLVSPERLVSFSVCPVPMWLLLGFFSWSDGFIVMSGASTRISAVNSFSNPSC